VAPAGSVLDLDPYALARAVWPQAALRDETFKTLLARRGE
jgi:hypothetical protein